MSQPITGWRFSIDGERSDTAMHMAEMAGLPIPLCGEKYAFEGVEYLVRNSQINYVGGDSPTAIAAVHLETMPNG